MNKKLGPLPVWAWGLILGVGGYFAYTRYRSSATAAPSSGVGVGGAILDPNAVDPNTGLTYGQEEDAALNANAAGGPSLGGGGVGASGAQSTVPDPTGTGLTDLPGILIDPATIAKLIGLIPTPGSTTASPSTTAAASSPPVAAGHGPTVTATAHTSPAQLAQAAQSHTALEQVNSLLSSGFRKVQGSTQAGGLAQTGTYVYTPPKGSSLHTGPTKYFVYGTQATGLHVRPAS